MLPINILLLQDKQEAKTVHFNYYIICLAKYT